MNQLTAKPPSAKAVTLESIAAAVRSDDDLAGDLGAVGGEDLRLDDDGGREVGGIGPSDHEPARAERDDGGIRLAAEGDGVDEDLAAEPCAGGVENLRLDRDAAAVAAKIGIGPGGDEAATAEAGDSDIDLVAIGRRIDLLLAADLRPGRVEQLHPDRLAAAVAGRSRHHPGDDEAAVGDAGDVRPLMNAAAPRCADADFAAHLGPARIQDLGLDHAVVVPGHGESAGGEGGDGGIFLDRAGRGVDDEFVADRDAGGGGSAP